RVIHSSRSVGFTGWIGGVAVFNRPLSVEELAKLSAIRSESPESLPPFNHESTDDEPNAIHSP
ncbi:MAG: hypothetical protein MUE50_07035, partial [Pirellulaceae bacterium]|nr:hypothetical protein [Pirellulaceae bacterium]